MREKIHEGKRLKEYLKAKGISSDELKGKLKLSDQSLYYQFRREYLSPKFKTMLAAIQIDFHATGNTDTIHYPADYEELKRDAKRLREIVILQAQHIEELRKSLAEAHQQVV